MNTSDQVWYDNEDHSPAVRCEVELKNGRFLMAFYTCGALALMDRKVIGEP